MTSFTTAKKFFLEYQAMILEIRTDVVPHFAALEVISVRWSLKLPVVADSKIRQLTRSGCLPAIFRASGPPPDQPYIATLSILRWSKSAAHASAYSEYRLELDFSFDLP